MTTMERRSAASLEWTCCTVHPDVALPIPIAESERFLCYACKQTERQRRYKEQKDEWERQQKLGFRSRYTSFVVTEGFTTELIDVAKRIIEARKRRYISGQLQGPDI